MITTKTIQLEETSIGGDSNPLNRRFYADGKRITRDEFDAIKRDPHRPALIAFVAGFGAVAAYLAFVFFYL